jgi:hypothetical protein
MTSWWENKSIVWTEGIKQMDLVIKDNSGGSGHAHKRPDAEHFFPTKMRITMIQVSAGSTYDPGLVKLGQAFDPERRRSGPREGRAGVAGGPNFFPIASDFNFAVFQRARETKDRLIDLISGLLARHHLKRDPIPFDCTLEYRRAAVVDV